jgi:hypothetical protein
MGKVDDLEEFMRELMINETVPSIRILPMSEQDPEFIGFSIEDMQEWFSTVLPKRVYQFKTGMNTELGTIVLFQYKGHIVALATLADKILYKKKLIDGYKGCYVFEPYSIATFLPVTALEMKGIWPDFKGFNQSQQILHTDLEQYIKFSNLLKKKNNKQLLK